MESSDQFNQTAGRPAGGRFPWGIAAAVAVAIFLAVAAFWSGGTGRDLFGDRNSLSPFGQTGSTAKELNIRPISQSDHYRGDLNAPVKIIEYSDLECPFCKQFHQTMKQVFSQYGETGELLWVFRHFPLEGLHQKAKAEAAATECARAIGGLPGFWAYLEKIFAVTPSNDGLDLSLLPVLAQEVGLDRSEFEACLARNDYLAKIDADIADAVQNGGQGTPFPIIIGPDGRQTALAGAVPLAQLKTLIDAELAKVK